VACLAWWRRRGRISSTPTSRSCAHYRGLAASACTIG